MAALLKAQAFGPAVARVAPTHRFAFKPCVIPAVRPIAAPSPLATPVKRGALQVVAAGPGDKEKKKKKMDSAVKRELVAERNRRRNKGRKSACATRIKKVIKLAEQMMANPPKTEDEVKPLEKLIAEAYSEIDKARVKGVMHLNTAARRKMRCAAYKRKVLMAAGLFVPAADHPDYARYQKMQAAKAPAAQA